MKIYVHTNHNGRIQLKLFMILPDILLCNGPGTCIPILCVAFLFKVLLKNHKMCFVVPLIVLLTHLWCLEELTNICKQLQIFFLIANKTKTA